MSKVAITGAILAALLVLAVAVGRSSERDREAAMSEDAEATAVTAHATGGFLHGRVTMKGGEVYEGRLRWGGDEEALWGNYFNGFKDENPWAAEVARERLPQDARSIEVFGIELFTWERPRDLGRPFMVRFGDIALIEPRGRDIRVTMKSGRVVELDRFSADDLADGLRVWDTQHGVVDLDEWSIRSVELLAAPGHDEVPGPLHGTVHTARGAFTGLLQWDREAGVWTDEIVGHSEEGPVRLSFAAIRSIARRSGGSARVTLRDGREIVLSGTRAVGDGNRGVYVDDPRYGRVLVSWSALERVDFSDGGAAPAYGDFPPGRPLTGSVVTKAGRRLSGRLVYDLDESETNETLDAPFAGVDYTIPFGLVASIARLDADGDGAGGDRVVLHSGEEIWLERGGDLGEGNAGVLVLHEADQGSEYVPWTDVGTIEFDRPTQMFPRPER